MFSILIPTYDNINYLKICIDSIKKNSNFAHQIIVHINEGNDGSLEYVKNLNIDYTHSNKNIGMSKALNTASKLAKQDYIIISHDDFYYCPNWDLELKKEINLINHDKFYLSGYAFTEAKNKNDHFAEKINFGKTAESFDEDKILNNLDKIQQVNWQGTTKHPGLVHKSMWQKVGGWSEQFFPTGGDDTDFAIKLLNADVRIFKGIGKCLIYHFESITTRKKNNSTNTYLGSKANKIFMMKWGMSINFFETFYLQAGLDKNKNFNFNKYNGPLKEPVRNFNFFLKLLIIKLNIIYLKIISGIS